MAKPQDTYAWGVTPGSPVLSIEEATRLELERRAEYEARPDVMARKADQARWKEKQALMKEAEKQAKKGLPLYGPPNPYKPHRKIGPEDRGGGSD